MTICISQPPEIVARLDRLAAEQNLSRSWIIANVLRGWLDEHAPELKHATSPRADHLEARA